MFYAGTSNVNARKEGWSVLLSSFKSSDGCDKKLSWEKSLIRTFVDGGFEKTWCFSIWKNIARNVRDVPARA